MSTERVNILVIAFKEKAPNGKPTIAVIGEFVDLVDVTGKEITEAWNQYQAELKKASGNDTTKAKSKTKEVDGVFVRAAPGVGSFRRAGYSFDETGTGFATDVFTEEELDSFEDEKRLVVEYVTFTADDTFIAE